MEDDDIAPLWLLKEILHFIDQDVFVIMEIRLHALPIRAEALNRETNNAKYQQRKSNNFNDFPNEACIFF